MSNLGLAVMHCEPLHYEPCQTKSCRFFEVRWSLLCPCLPPVQVWVSSVTEITLDDLSVQDQDTPPEELHFMVTPPSNGHLALKSAPMKAVLNFTQAHIDQGQLVFVHKGKCIFHAITERGLLNLIF